MIKIEIKNRWTGLILFEYSKDNNTIRETVIEAIQIGANLRGANLRGANLRGANLIGANLRGANLRGANLIGANLIDANLRDANLRDADLRDADLRDADLRGANLRGADLRDADLRGANLRGANLRVIKNDMFIVLLHGRSEIQFLKQNIIDGKINGSTYEGECCCLSGTLVNGARATNGPQEALKINSICSVRDSSRPIERFFLGIKTGDTPETSQFSKLALEWIEEFEALIK